MPATQRPVSFLLRAFVALCGATMGACVATRPPPAPPPVALAWEQRASELQRANRWDLEGRAAAAVGTQGWQASLSWRQRGEEAEIRFAGPLGVAATLLRLTPSGLSVDGAPPGGDAVAQLQQRVGLPLPLDSMRFWLLGVANPTEPFEVVRNEMDRARQIQQGGWTIDYDRYLPVERDWLPGRLVLSREGVRVRIAIDRWDGPR